MLPSATATFVAPYRSPSRAVARSVYDAMFVPVPSLAHPAVDPSSNDPFLNPFGRHPFHRANPLRLAQRSDASGIPSPSPSDPPPQLLLVRLLVEERTSVSL